MTNLPDLDRKARSNGTVRVIAELDVAPGGRLAARDRQSVAEGVGVPAGRVVPFETIPFVVLEVDAAQLARLAAMPNIIDIQEDEAMPPSLASSNTVIGAGTAWAAGFTGAGQTVAILDTGVDAMHPFFNSGTNKVVSEACYSSSTSGASASLCPDGAPSSTAAGSARNCPTEVFGCFHGTHVAGIMAGNDGIGPNFGVARDAGVIAIQVFSRFESPSTCGLNTAPCVLSFTSDQIRGLERVLALRDDFHIAAVNMSLGAGLTFSGSSICDAFYRSTKMAVDNLRAAGIATVIAAGNGGARGGISPPACISSAISVGATDDADNVAAFSNVAGFLSLLAPGVAVTSSVPGGGLGRAQGTSMSAPHVAGMWALMRQADPTADVATILARLRETGTAVNDQRGGGTVTGMRRIDAAAAVAGTTRTFTIHNDGNVMLYVASINRLTPAAWISWTPAAPFFIPAGGSQPITVTIDLAAAPLGSSTTRLIVDSTDADKAPYPDGAFIVVNKSELPTVTIAASDATATEAGATTGAVTATRSGPTAAPLNVGYFLGGGATSGADFAALSGTVTIPAGSSSATIVIAPVDDADAEDDETVVVGIATNATYVIGSPGNATVTIGSDDLPAINVIAIDGICAENGPDHGAAFSITRTGLIAAPLTIEYALGGSATNGVDYATLSGTVTIAAGAASATVAVTPIEDALAEGSETLVLSIVAGPSFQVGATGSALVTIADALAAPANVVATASSPMSVVVSWTPVAGAASYRVYRADSFTPFALVGSPAAPPFTDAVTFAGVSYLYKVRAFGLAESPDSSVDLATTFVFTDPILTGTTIRALHFTELLEAVNAVRWLAGAGFIGFTQSGPAAGAVVPAQHLQELRASLAVARAALGLPAWTWTDPAIAAGATTIKAVHLQELRDAVK